MIDEVMCLKLGEGEVDALGGLLHEFSRAITGGKNHGKKSNTKEPDSKQTT